MHARWLDTRTAAEFLSLSPHTLEKWRAMGHGPRFHKFGSLVRYTVEDLEAFTLAAARGG